MQFKEEALKNNCTFQPKINKENTPVKVKNKVADIDAWKKKIQDKLFEEYFDNNHRNTNTFKPTLSKKSIEIVRSKTPE